MYWYIVHLKVYIVYTLYLESRHVILPFWKLLPVDGFKPTMHAVQQMVVWHSLHGSVYRSEASEIHESSCLATRKDILTCWNSRPCDDAWLPIFDLFGSNRGQDRGGVVEREDPFMQLLQANKARMNGKDMMGVQLQLPGAFV